MSYTYTQQKNKNSKQTDAEPFSGRITESAFPNSALLEAPGHQVEMPVVMREKMEGAFGMDLTAVKLYENKAVGEAGAEAVAQGSRIAFAPGKLDFSSIRGQALLGHEISHVASQARGEVPGSGLVKDSALEARADREGLMAARGESVTSPYGGASAALSNASAASAAGPMQAKSGRRDPDARNVKRMQQSGLNYNSNYATSDMEGYDDLSSGRWQAKTHTPNWFSRFFGKRITNYKKRRSPLPPLSLAVAPQSVESYDLLNSQQGTTAERLDAYRNLANQVEQNTTPEEQAELDNYVTGSEPTNLLLRGQKEKTLYPHKKEFRDDALRTSKLVSSAIEKNRIQKDMNVFRGIPDSKLGEILVQKGLTRAVKPNGGLDHQWIRNNMPKVQRALINTTFADNGFTSTTTEKSFAKYWAQRKNQIETMDRLERIEDKTPEERQEYNRFMVANPKENNVPGGHVIKMSLPAGSRAAPIGAAAKIPGKVPYVEQHEVLVDKGSLFKITGFDVNNDEGAGPDSFNLMMELLSDEEGMEPTGNIAENLIQPNGGGSNLINAHDDEDLKVETNKRKAAKNLIRPNGGAKNLLIDRVSKDLKAAAGSEDPAENLLEPVGGGNDLVIGNGDEDMQMEVDRGDTAQLKRWKKKQKGKRKRRHGLHEVNF